MLSLLNIAPDWEWASEAMVLAIAGTIERAATLLEGVPSAFQRSHHPDDLRRQFEAIAEADVRPLLADIKVPTIIGLSALSAAQRRVEGVHDIAAGIPGAQLVGGEWGTFEGVVAQQVEFLRNIDRPVQEAPFAGARTREAGAFRAILFTDLAAHTEMMGRLGDEAGREILREHERITREALAEHGGAEVKTLGDGFMASFGGVSQSLKCAQALQRAFEKPLASGYRLNVRIGINAGEPIEEDDDLFGTSVIVAARTAASAGGGQIVVTDVVRQLVAGKEFLFADRGLSTLKGFEDPVRTWEVLW
jgi:class 3 adenylate cyclase